MRRGRHVRFWNAKLGRGMVTLIEASYQEPLAAPETYPNPLALNTIENRDTLYWARKPRTADLEPSSPVGALSVPLIRGAFPLTSLPPDILFVVGDFLPTRCLARLRACSRALHQLLTRSLYDRQLLRMNEQLVASYPLDQRDYLLLMAVGNSSVLAANHYLLAGANPCTLDTRSNHSWTVLMIAAARGGVEQCKVLLRWGANAEHVSADGLTALHVAARKGFVHAVAVVAQSCPVDILTPSGESPLHFAATSGHHAVVGFLLDKGADGARPDKQGKTPLVCAGDAGAGPDARRCVHSWADKRTHLSTIEHAIVSGGNAMKWRRRIVEDAADIIEVLPVKSCMKGERKKEKNMVKRNKNTRRR